MSLRVRAWSVTAMVVVFMLINFADKVVLGLSAVPIMRELSLGPSEYGLLASSFYFLFSISSLVFGVVSTRWSSRTVLGAIALGWAVSVVPLLVLVALPALFMSRILLGFFEGPANAMSLHALFRWFPDDRRSLPAALQLAGGSMGVFVAAPVLGWIIARHGWLTAFVVLGIASAAWALLWLVIGKDGPFGAGNTRVAEEAAAPRQRPDLLALLRGVATNRVVVGIIVAQFGCYWALVLGQAWLPAYLENGIGYSAAQTVAVVSLHSGTSIVITLLGVPLSGLLIRRGVTSRLARGVATGGAVGLAGVCLALIPVVSVEPLRIVLIAIAFSFAGLAFPLGFLTLGEVVPVADRGFVFGLVTMLSTLPGIIAPYVTGVVVGAAGFGAAFVLGGLLVAATGLWGMWTIDPDRYRVGTPATSRVPAAVVE